METTTIIDIISKISEAEKEYIENELYKIFSKYE